MAGHATPPPSAASRRARFGRADGRFGSRPAPRRALLAGLAAATLSASAAVAAVAPAANADTAPPSGTPATVSADSLPTVQINGVAWDQVTVGNTVYVTGSFSQARPAGAAAGTNQTARANLLAYDIRTGALITSFNHRLNGQGLTVAASPDGSRVYVGGEFTQVDGVARSRIAAFATSNGALVTTFTPALNGTVRALTATNATVYAGGSFTTAAGVARSRAAAFAASNGALQAWNPRPNTTVGALVMAPDNSRVIIGGRFSTLNGATHVGIGAVSAGGAGGDVSWNPAWPIVAVGNDSTYTSLVSDGTSIYGTTYQFGPTGNFEGRFAANPYTGELLWANSCHGDSYAAWANAGVLYSAGHAHDCSDIGDFPQDANRVFASTHFFMLAESTAATGVNRKVVFSGGGGLPGPIYADWAGTRHSAALNWYPAFRAGTYTGQSQAAWSVSGNASYVSVGGEFPSVNGTAQQGLARFALRAGAPNRVGPAANSQLTPTVVSQSPGTARVAWRTTSDQDNVTLTYRLYRDGGTTPILTRTVDTRFWYRPALSYVDTGLATGSRHTYRVTVTDPLGNVRSGGTSAAVTIGTANPTPYVATVLADGASNFWPLSEASGTAGLDYAGGNDLRLGTAVTRGAAGPSAAGAATAATFDGTAASYTTSVANGERLSAFSVEAWVKTTSTSGGEIVGYGLSNFEGSANTDRTLYLSPAGLPFFGVWSNNANVTVTGPNAINDGTWHHLVGSVAAGGGMSLYVDGQLAASGPAIVSSSVLSGYWRIGGDTLNGWPAAPTGPLSSFNLVGSIADVAVYATPLTAAQVSAHATTPAAAAVAPAPEPATPIEPTATATAAN